MMDATSNTPTVLVVLAHPDDESFPMGGTLAKYAAQGARVTLLTAGPLLSGSSPWAQGGIAAAVGDDRLQAQAGVQITPDSWTHGSSEQRMSWLTTGFETGDPGKCDTFSGDI